MKPTGKIFCMTLIAISLFISSCSQRREATEKKTITWTFWGSPEAMQTYGKIVQDFEDENTGIKVNLMNIPPSAYGTKLSTMIAGGTAPDIFWIGGDHVADYALRGTIKELSSLAERDAEKIDIDDFYEATLKAGTFKGKLYGIPKGINPIIIAYNKDMFDEAGLKYPSEDWTWDDFLSAAKELTKDKDGDGRTDQFGFCGLGKEYWQWLPFVLQNGGAIFDESNTTSTFDMSETAEALGFYVDLVHKHHVAPAAGQTADLDFFAQFTNRMVAMTMGAHTFVLVFNRHKDLNWDIVPLPKNKHKATVLTLGFFAISSQTRYLEEAWKFVCYITSQKAAGEYFHVLGEEMPPRKSLSHIQDNPLLAPEHHQIFFSEVEYAYPLPVIPGWQEIYDVIMKEFELAVLGQKKVEQVCPAIKKELDRLLAHHAE